jgi:hypothetical protein
MSTTTNLSLPYLASGQAQKHVTVNESLQRLDALVQLSAESATTTAQPASPADGAVYVLPTGKTGAAWGAMAVGALAYHVDGAWQQITPHEGWRAFVRDTDALMVFTGAAWVACPVGLASDAETRAQTDAQKALTPANLAARACFSAHKNNSDQTGITANTFTKLTFGTEAFDVGGCFDTTNARWTPPAGKVRLSGGFYVASGGGTSGLVLACLYKNGSLMKQFIFGASAAAQAGFFTAVDAANGTDYYEFFCYAPSGSTYTVSGHPANTHFSGEQI